MIPALLALAVAAAFLPELMAWLGFGTPGAWFFVVSGAESWALWVLVAGFVSAKQILPHCKTLAQCVCAWAAFEAAQRPVCRLAFPMDRAPPPMPAGKNLCDIATGLPMSWVSVVAALFLAALVQEHQRARP